MSYCHSDIILVSNMLNRSRDPLIPEEDYILIKYINVSLICITILNGSGPSVIANISIRLNNFNSPNIFWKKKWMWRECTIKLFLNSKLSLLCLRTILKTSFSFLLDSVPPVQAAPQGWMIELSKIIFFNV